MTPEQIADNKKTIIDLLHTVDENCCRGKMDVLIDSMVNKGFFTAPCSTQYHLAEEGGLAEHSLNVFDAMCALNTSLMNDELDMNSIILVSLLHDLGKCGDHGKPNYVPKVLKSGKAAASPYETNKELTYEEHEIRSLLIAERCIYLTEQEETAILHHNGLYGKLDSAYGTHNFDKEPLTFLLHTADMWVSRFVEVEKKGENE